MTAGPGGGANRAYEEEQMIRSTLRGLKRFWLRHLGLTQVLESGSATRREVDALRAQLAALRDASEAEAAARRHEAADVRGQLAEVRAALDRACQALARNAAGAEDGFHHARACVERESHNVRAKLEEQFNSASRERLATLGAMQETLQTVRGIVDGIAVWDLNRWKVLELEGLLRHLRKQDYLAAIREGRLEVPVLETAHPVAVESHDARFPWGAKNDNSICPRFNSRLYQLLAPKKRLAVLDLGCAGGGLVRTLIDDGHLAVGLEGSDYPKVNQAGEWGTIPHHLHTCDVTKPFRLRHPGGATVKFDAITAWEVMEHIHDRDLDCLVGNIREHLAGDGYFLCSVSTVEDGIPEIGAVYHQTVQPREWWLDRFRGLGMEVVEQDAIGRYDWLRGSGNARIDNCSEDQGVGFHLALRHARSA